MVSFRIYSEGGARGFVEVDVGLREEKSQEASSVMD